MQYKIKEIMSDILEVSDSDIGEKFGPNDAGNWDSLNNLKLITALESEFNIQLTMSEIREMVDFGAIVSIIESKLN